MPDVPDVPNVPNTAPHELPAVAQVTCSDGVTRTVYAKDDATLGRLLAISAALVQGADAALAAIPDGQPDANALGAASIRDLMRGDAARAYAWIATHPGPGMPYTTPPTGCVALPAWTETLTPHDLTAFNAAIVAANRDALVRIFGAETANAAVAFTRAILTETRGPAR